MSSSDAFGVRLAVAGMLLMGTVKTLLSKLMYGIEARGIDGSVHSFEVRAERPPQPAPARCAPRPPAPRCLASLLRSARCAARLGFTRTRVRTGLFGRRLAR